MSISPGNLFRQKVSQNGRPLQIVGAVNAYCARLAQSAGASALYLSGSGVATASHGLPDLGMTTLQDVVHDASAITSATPHLPLLVDLDTGFGGTPLTMGRTIREMVRAGVAAVHIEDQHTDRKRCGHRPGTRLVSTATMVRRIEAAIQARTQVHSDMVLMARTDAMAVEGLEHTIERSHAYVEAGAEMLFIEACTTLQDYRAIHKALPNIPLLANATEFGKTPLWHVDELGDAGVSMVLYPLSAHRAMSKAALQVYDCILKDGHQRNVLPLMQTREELYHILDYHKYEQMLDQDDEENDKD